MKSQALARTAPLALTDDHLAQAWGGYSAECPDDGAATRRRGEGPTDGPGSAGDGGPGVGAGGDF